MHYFGYLRGERLPHADGIALRFTAAGFEWMDAGRQAFADGPPTCLRVEIVARRSSSVFEYRQPEPTKGRSTP